MALDKYDLVSCGIGLLAAVAGFSSPLDRAPVARLTAITLGIVATGRLAYMFHQEEQNYPLSVAQRHADRYVGMQHISYKAALQLPAPMLTVDVEAEPLPAAASEPAQLKPVSDPAPKTDDIQSLKATGRQIVRHLAGLRKSILAVAATRAGKSTTQACWLHDLFENYPAAEVYAIARKRDSFCGLDLHGRVYVIDEEQPALAFEALEVVYAIFKSRRETPERQRHCFTDQPVRLILADWYL